MKKIIPYLWILIPFFLIGAIQKSPFYQGWNKVQASNTKIDSNMVVYSLTSNDFQQLSKSNLTAQMKLINDSVDAVVFLKKYYELARTNANSTYAGFAISGYKAFPQNLKDDPSVQSIYADILSYAHDFDNAIALFKKLENIAIYQQQSILKMMNIYMLKGDYYGVEKQCDATKSFADYRISIACRLWLQGMQTDEINVTEYSLAKLTSISKNTDKEQSIDLWLHQLMLDLQLKAKLIQPAVVSLRDIYKTDEVDLSALIQVVDNLILIERYKLASDLIEQYDASAKLIVRRVILGEYLTDDKSLNVELAAELIINYITIQDTSKYREVALWKFLIDHDPSQATFYAKENIKTYNTELDQSLLSYASSSSSGIRGGR